MRRCFGFIFLSLWNSHLLENNRQDDAIEWMTDFEFTMSRFQALDLTGLATDSWYADWERLTKEGALSGDCKIWWEFARTNDIIFENLAGNPGGSFSGGDGSCG